MRHLIAILAMCCPALTQADTIVAARIIPAGTIIEPADIASNPTLPESGLSDIESVIGLEARIAIYKGRAIRREDLGPPTLVDRNQIVPLIYDQGGLEIRTEARALSKGGAGDVIRAMNLNSRQTVTAHVDADGVLRVAP